jgi:hypothetical protein
LARIPKLISQSWAATTSETGGFLTATLIGWAVELVYGIASQGIVDGIRVFCLLWFASGAAFFIGTIAGFLFGIPRANAESTRLNDLTVPAKPLPQDSMTLRASGYMDNTNLEQVSDWLTKIIVGIGLVQFDKIIEFLSRVGTKVGNAVDPTHSYGGDVIAVGSIVVGFATGFLYYYIWARVILRRSLLRTLELSTASIVSSNTAPSANDKP